MTRGHERHCPVFKRNESGAAGAYYISKNEKKKMAPFATSIKVYGYVCVIITGSTVESLRDQRSSIYHPIISAFPSLFSPPAIIWVYSIHA